MEELKVYSKTGCVWCDAVKALLIKKGVPFTEYRVDASLENLEDLKKLYPEAKTVPQVFLGEQRIGGFNEVQSYLTDVFGGAFGDDI